MSRCACLIDTMIVADDDCTYEVPTLLTSLNMKS